MAYGQFSGMSREQMKQVFSDALRWQLQRIEQDQTGSQADPGAHATANSLHAEAWEFFARGGIAARWTLGEHQRLIANGWSPAQAKTVANIVFDLQHGGVVSGEQVATYSTAFGFPVTTDNVGHVQRLICKARAAACREATARLSWREDDRGVDRRSTRRRHPLRFRTIRARRRARGRHGCPACPGRGRRTDAAATDPSEEGSD